MVPAGIELIVLIGGLVFAEHAERAVELRLVIGRVDLEQYLARFDIAAFGIVAFDEHSGDARRHVGAQIRRQSSNQVLGQIHRLRRDLNGVDRRGRRRRCRVLAAGGENQDCGDGRGPTEHGSEG